MTELPKTYDPAAIESGIYQAWLDEKCFHVEPNHPGRPYAIVIPPPNVTGALHLGHAINNTLQDILTRKARMEGKAALWMPGLDHAGIATQAVVEKTIKETEGKDRYSLADTPEKSREELVRRIWEWKQQYGDRIVSQLKRLGCSCDWDRTRFTLDEVCAKAVRETFFKLFKDGLVYRGKKLVNWDTHLQTSISNDEIYHEKIKTHLWHIRYEIVDSGSGFRVPGSGENAGNVEQTLVEHRVDETEGAFLETFSADPSFPEPGTRNPEPGFMTIATTRPETLLGDTAVAVNSQDPRWNWAIGKQVRLPLLGRLIPIIADDELVDPKFGSGVVKVTPAHDPNDYAVWERHRGQADAIDIINILEPNGTLNDAAGPYKGLTINKARHAVVNDLTKAGLLVKEEPYETEIGHSDRSKTPIQPYLSDQWFVKMAPLAEPALQVVRDGTIQFFPERHSQQYLSWLGEKRDWPISRQLWWGHRIPVWKKRINITVENRVDLVASGELEFLDAGEPVMSYYTEISTNIEPERETGRVFFQHVESGQIFRFDDSASGPPHACMPWVTPTLNGEFDVFVCVNAGAGLEHRLEKLGYVQDPDVLDTWFSSALWPHSTLGWPEETAELAKWYPTSVLLTGRDIITLWVARMVMMGMYNMGTVKPVGEGLAEVVNFGPEQYHDPANSPKRSDQAGHDPNLQTPESPEHEKELRLPPQSQISNPKSQITRDLGIPFAHVAINPTILDGKGERMSKSKGNGVDPVDVIDTHGADALRFTLATMATETQDVRMPVKKDAQGRNTSEKFDLGRNFCNKLWNAARFVLATLEQRGPGEVANPGTRNPEPGTLAERWILSRFNRTVDEANNALAVYRFDLYAKACYDFFWRDFCDWYLESTKLSLKDPKTKASVEQTLIAMLDGSLRLMHPVIPFITETIWGKLNDVAPNRSLCGRIHQRIMLSDWPTVGTPDDAAEREFTILQEIIGAIRLVRNEHKVEIKKPVTVSIQTSDDAALPVGDNKALIELLATCTIKTAGTNIAPPANAVRVTAAGCDVYIEDLADPAADAERQSKRTAELTREIAAMKGRLANAGYIAKAPPKLVEETRQKLADAEAELAKLTS